MKMKLKVLILDDQEDQYAIIHNLLGEDYEILPRRNDRKKVSQILSEYHKDTTNAHTCVKKILMQNNDIRMIFCDIRLGKSDRGGLSLISYVRKLKAKDLDLPDHFDWYSQLLPIIGITGGDDSIELQYLLADQGCIFLQKNDARMAGLIKKQVDAFSFLCESTHFPYQYTVAVSYTSRDTDSIFIKSLSQVLSLRYGSSNVFFDINNRDELHGATPKNEQIQTIFRKKAKSILVVLSPEYGSTEWTKVEWDIIKTLPSKRVRYMKGTEIVDAEMKNKLFGESSKKTIPILTNDIHLTHPISDYTMLDEFITEYCKYIEKLKEDLTKKLGIE